MLIPVLLNRDVFRLTFRNVPEPNSEQVSPADLHQAGLYRQDLREISVQFVMVPLDEEAPASGSALIEVVVRRLVLSYLE